MIGVTGYNGKIGSLLVRRANFVKFDCDITDVESIEKELKINPVDLIVNLAAKSDLEYCEDHHEIALKTNVRGLYNLHDVFGDRVLNIGSSCVYAGRNKKEMTEKDKGVPINYYGWTKLGAEAVSSIFGGKTLRLSRTVSMYDRDLAMYIQNVYNKVEITPPSFFIRGFLHREFAVNGIEYFANNFDRLPAKINYDGIEKVSTYKFLVELSRKLGLDLSVITPRLEENTGYAPRPHKAGLDISLARKCGFPVYTISDTINRLAQELNG